MHAQPVAVQLFAAVLTATLFELARLSVWILAAVVSLMFENASGREASAAEFALGVFRRRRSHF
jgi:hypothetical protein